MIALHNSGLPPKDGYLPATHKLLSNDEVSAPSPQQRALLVEDDIIIQKIQSRYFEILEFTVDIASNGQQALALYQAGKYAIVALDVGLPDTTGFDLAKIIRNQDVPGQRQFIVMISAHSQEEIKEKTTAANIDEFMTKPISLEKLKEIVERRLSHAKTNFE